jgi:hypothetical protein
MYKIGDGVSRDPDKAKLFFDKMIEIVKSQKERRDLGLTG